MENRRRKNRYLKKSTINRPLLIGVIAAVAAVALIVLAICAFSVNIDLQVTGGTDPITVVYGDAYQEQGATATANGKEIEVTIGGEVDNTKLGTYKVTYTAKHLWKTVTAEREVRVIDTTLPVIELKSDPAHITKPGEAYEEEGFTATDDYDGDITDKVERVESEGRVTYKVKDSSGNETVVVREIRYTDVVAPQIVLTGEAEITLQAGDSYAEPGFTATDDVDGDITDRVEISGTVDPKRAGTYTVTYTVKDSYGNTAEMKRTVTVKPAKQQETVTPDGKVVYLTFDDGPGRYTQTLLDMLAKYNAKATFFVVNTGASMSTHLNNMVKGGHAIGIHSLTHDYKTIYSSDDAFFSDLYAMQDIIEKNCGVKTMLMRFPGGSSNTVSRKHSQGIMTRLTKAVKDQGFRYFDWNVSSQDTATVKDTNTIANNIISGIKGKKTAVVLQHDIYKESVAAVEQVIQWGLDNGYRFEALTMTSPKCEHGVNN